MGDEDAVGLIRSAVGGGSPVISASASNIRDNICTAVENQHLQPIKTIPSSSNPAANESVETDGFGPNSSGRI